MSSREFRQGDLNRRQFHFYGNPGQCQWGVEKKRLNLVHFTGSAGGWGGQATRLPRVHDAEN